MCDPTLIYLGVTAAAGIYSASQQMAQGEAQSDYYNAVAKNQQEQARIARETGQHQAELVQDTAKYQGTRLAQDQAKERSAQVAAAAAMGVYGGVTLDDLAKDTANVQGQDTTLLRYNADVRSWESTVGAANRSYALETEASYSKYSAANAKATGRTNAFSTLLGTAVSMAAPFAFKPFAPTRAVAGRGGYLAGTPSNAWDMGNYTRIGLG